MNAACSDIPQLLRVTAPRAPPFLTAIGINRHLIFKRVVFLRFFCSSPLFILNSALFSSNPHFVDIVSAVKAHPPLKSLVDRLICPSSSILQCPTITKAEATARASTAARKATTAHLKFLLHGLPSGTAVTTAGSSSTARLASAPSSILNSPTVEVGVVTAAITNKGMAVKTKENTPSRSHSPNHTLAGTWLLEWLRVPLGVLC